VNAELQEGKLNPERDETEAERVDRNLSELINEIRVALPGIQVLFAFLLILPFNTRFADLTEGQKNLYFAVLVCTALSATLLIAPTMHHRLQFRKNRKARVLFYSHRLSIAGLSLLAVAMSGAVFLVGDFVFGTTAAAIGTSIPALAIAVTWYVLPALGRDD
jgi:Ca2+/Na+ antiporter